MMRPLAAAWNSSSRGDCKECSDDGGRGGDAADSIWILAPFVLLPSDGVFGRFDLAALCGCHTLYVCLFVYAGSNSGVCQGAQYRSSSSDLVSVLLPIVVS
jgi:hypothetical protein